MRCLELKAQLRKLLTINSYHIQISHCKNKKNNPKVVFNYNHGLRILSNSIYQNVLIYPEISFTKRLSKIIIVFIFIDKLV